MAVFVFSPFSTATIALYFVSIVCTFSFRFTPFSPNADLALGVIIPDMVIPPDGQGPSPDCSELPRSEGIWRNIDFCTATTDLVIPPA